MNFPLLLCCGLSAAVLPVRAAYDADVGYLQLKAELGDAMLTGAGVGATQVEPSNAAGGYMPQAGSGSFAGTGYWTGKTFNARTGATVFSNHANEVGFHFYGSNTNPGNGRASIAPGITLIDGWNANIWDDDFLKPGADDLEPLVELRAVQNHAWIFSADAGSGTSIRDLVRRQDYSIHRDNYVCSVGLGNDPAGDIPDIWASAYNVITVGRTDGQHSRGTTTGDMDGGGRRKPEIVAPLDANSFTTAYVAGAAALLRERANTTGPLNARCNRTIKAVLLAGATKEEFPGWSRTAAHPIDAVYGAGELNIYNSYHILAGGEQPVNQVPGRPHFAWDYHTLSANSTADYRLQIPAGRYGVELSAFLVWHRTLTDTNASATVFSLTPDALVNFDLTLFRDPAAGGTPVNLDASTSTLYNLEHIWRTNLPAGNYRLRVSRGSGNGHDFALAWRLTSAPQVPQVLIAPAGNSLRFDFTGLIPGQPYKFQDSPDMQTWHDLESFTATTTTATRTRLKSAAPRYFYQLLPVLP